MESTEHPTSGETSPKAQAPQPLVTTPPSPMYISVKDTAHLLGVKPVTVYRRYHAGQFPGRKFGRSIDILRTFVDALITEITSGRSVDVEAFAAAWSAKASEEAA